MPRCHRPEEYRIKASNRRTLDPLTDDAELIDYMPGKKPAERCPRCQGNGRVSVKGKRDILLKTCVHCRGVGFFDLGTRYMIDPTVSYREKQGSAWTQSRLTAFHEMCESAEGLRFEADFWMND